MSYENNEHYKINVDRKIYKIKKNVHCLNALWTCKKKKKTFKLIKQIKSKGALNCSISLNKHKSVSASANYVKIPNAKSNQRNN